MDNEIASIESWVEDNRYWGDTKNGRNSCLVVNAEELQEFVAGKVLLPGEPTEEMARTFFCTVVGSEEAWESFSESEKVDSTRHFRLVLFNLIRSFLEKE